MRDVGREDDPNGLVTLEVDVGMVFLRAGRLGHPVDEGHGSLEAFEGEGLRERRSVACPAGAGGEEGSERGLVEPHLSLRVRHDRESRVYALNTRNVEMSYTSHPN